MEIPREIDEYLKGTIDESVGLAVSSTTLRTKLHVLEESNRRLAEQQLVLLQRLRRKDQLIERAKAEATMNAVALKKFVEENQRLATECASLVAQCQKLENECSLYDRDREALMDFGNEADERAKVAEYRLRESEEMLENVSEELKFYKNEYEARSFCSSAENCNVEDNVLESILATLVDEDELDPGRILLDPNMDSVHCQQLLAKWDCLRQSTQKALLVAAKAASLRNDKEHLRINLNRAEEEANLLFKENSILFEENKKLRKQYNKERKRSSTENCNGSASSVKASNKRKSSCSSSPVEMKLAEPKDIDSVRLPLSPLLFNSPESRMYKK